MSKQVKIILQMDAETGKLHGKVVSVQKDLDKLASVAEKAGNAMERSSDKAKKSFGRAKKGVESISNQLVRMQKVAITAFAAVQLKDFIAGTVQLADKYKALNAQLQLVSTTAQEFYQVQTQLTDVAFQTHTDLQDLSKLYGAMSSSMKQLGLDTTQSIRVVELFNKSLSLSQPTATEASAATLQFAQAMGSGVLRGEEFNSIMENGRGVAMALAKGLGVPIGALRSMAEQGQLTADVVVQALQHSADYIESGYKIQPLTVSRAWADVKNAVMESVGELENGVQATQSLAQWLSKSARWLQQIDFTEQWHALVKGTKEATAVLNYFFTSTVNSYKYLFAMASDGWHLAGLEIKAFVDKSMVSLSEFYDKTLHKMADWAGKLSHAVRAMGMDDTANSLDRVWVSLEQGADASGKARSAYQETSRAIRTLKSDHEAYKKSLQEEIALSKQAIQTAVEWQAEKLKVQLPTQAKVAPISLNKTPAATGDYQKMLDAQTGEFEKAIEQINKQMDDAIAKAGDFGDTWTRTGDKVLDALGSMTAALSKAYQTDLNYQKLLKKAEDEGMKNTLKYKKLEEARAKASIKGSMDMLAASVTMFKKGSAEQKAAHDAYLAMSAIEMSVNLQKAISNAVVAVSNQGQGDPYTAFARVAAMSVMMAGVLSQLGASFGGGGGVSAAVASQPAPDAGVLGGGETESVSKSWEALQDINAKQYKELRGIYDEMQQLNNNLTSVVSSLYATGDLHNLSASASDYSATIAEKFTGAVSNLVKDIPVLNWATDFAGGIINDVWTGITGGGTKKSTSDYGLNIGGTLADTSVSGYETIKYNKDGGWFRKSKTWYKDKERSISEQSQAYFSDIFKNMRDAFTEYGDALGKDISTQLSTAKIDIGKISMQGSSEEVQKRLQEALSKQSDKLAYDLFPNLIKGYQQVNESAFDTLNRLVIDKAVTTDLLGMTGQKMVGDAIALSESLVAIAGGLKELQDATQTYFDKFATDAEKQAYNYQKLTDQLKASNLVLPKTRDAYKAVVESLDMTTEAGQKAYVTLMQAADAADQYYASIEKGILQLKDALDSAYETIMGQSVDALTYAQAQGQLFSALDAAKSGGSLPEADSLKSVLNVLTNNSADNYASYADYVRDQQVTANALKEFADLADSQLTTEDKMLAELKKQTDLLLSMDKSTASTAIDIINGLTNQFDKIDTTLDGLINYDEFGKYFDGIASDEQLKSIFNELDANGDGTLSKLEVNNNSLSSLITGLETVSTNTADTVKNTGIIALDTGSSASEVSTEGKTWLETASDELTNAIDAIGAKEAIDGFTDSVGDVARDTVSSASDILSDAFAFKFSDGGYTGPGGVNDVAGIVHKGEYVVPQWMIGKLGGKEFISQMESLRMHGSHATGLANVPFDGYRAELHKDEAVIDARTMSGLRKYGININNGGNQQLITEVQAMRREIQVMRESQESGLYAVAKNTGETAQMLEKWDYDGQPEVRTL